MRNLKNEDVSIAASQALKERNYWLTKLGGELLRSNFPYDHIKRENINPGLKIKTFKITHHLFARLMELSKGSDYTLYMVTVAVLVLLLNKYTHLTDIIVGAPIDRQDQEGDFINTVLPLRNQIKEGMNFKDLLLQVRQNIIEATEHQNYPMETLLFDLGMEYSEDEFPLFDVAVLLENIQERKYIRHIHSSLTFSFLRTDEALEGNLIYNSLLYDEETIEQIAKHFTSLMNYTLFNAGISVFEVEVLSEEEKKQQLFKFNDTSAQHLADRTLHGLFEEQAARTPGSTAVGFTMDLSDIYKELNSAKIDVKRLERLGTGCFRTNPFIFTAQLNQFDEKNSFKFLKTHRHDIVVVNENVVQLLNLFDGERNLNSIYSELKGSRLNFLLYSISIDDVLEISYQFDRKIEISLSHQFEDMVRLVKILYKYNLIELADVNPNNIAFDIPILENFDPYDALEKKMLLEDLFKYKKDLGQAEVLLLGDTPGQSTAGLLYMASYLRRHDIKTYALFNHSSWHSRQLKEQVEELLEIVKPRVVGISMKWFLHIARVIEIGKIVKAYAQDHSRDITVVVGGNSASFYWEEIIKNDCFDYLIRGDGEVPLLKICQGADPADIPNCVYRREGKVIANPITYIQTPDNSTDIYLSHMDEILLSDYACIFGIFFIFTQKGCEKNCHYCGGCNIAQRRSFNRPILSRRNISEVRKDIIASTPYSSTIYFLFDDYSNENLLDYCKKIWEDIDLSNHFGFLSNVIPPSPELIEYSNKVFKYVYWNIDMASMSGRHRQQLLELNMVKYQPTDREVLAMFDECEKYDNNEILINIITGLPYFNEEDIKRSEEIETYIMDHYSCFGEFFWARLHAEPGAPVVKNAEKYKMYSLAHTFEEFFEFSQRNFYDNDIYPNVDNYDYPFIYFKDEEFNSQVSKYYSGTFIKSLQYRGEQKQKLNSYYKQLSYQELNQKANQIAGLLRNRGVTPGTPVGIMVERSLEMIVGLLGILKAGGLYLPLDPDHPRKRITYILEESEVNILLTRQNLKDNIIFPGDIINLEQKELCREKDDYTPEPVNKPTDLAYMIFTSGSTGRPKGVMVRHQAIVNTVSWRKNYYRFHQGDAILQVPAYFFDSSVEDIFTPLIIGSRLILTPQQKLFDMKFLEEVFKKHKITHFLITPALYKVFLGEIYESLREMKSVTVAGDHFTEELVAEHFKKLPQVELYNEYGPTENSVCTTVYQFKPDSPQVLIGKPIDNVKCYVLSPDWKLNPIGVVGELCASGPGLAAGYQNNPELTGQKFVPHPFESDQRLYRTGDVARWRPGGNIQFLGRMDHQVKVRGFRIELEEIEAQLLKHSSIKDAVVIVRENETGDRQICAYIVTAADIEIPGLRDALSQQLPYYMVPSFFTVIDKIPVTPNGKVDRRALPEPGLSTNLKYLPPQTRLQERLRRLWAQELGMDQNKISIDASFFDLGGDSLKATTLIAKIHKECNFQIPLIELFRTPTISGLSEIIGESAGDEYSPIDPVEEKEYYVLSSSQRRLFVLNHIEGASKSYNLPQLLSMQGEVDSKKLEQTCKQLISRHESLRTSFQMINEGPVQRVRPASEIEFVSQYDDITDNLKAASEIQLINNFIRPFDLSQAPLLRVGLIKKAEKKYIFMFDMHHIVTDAVSRNVLIKEFMSLYNGKKLPCLGVQYKDYSRWQQSQVGQEVFHRQKQYWLEKFQGDIPILEMPLDYSRPALQSFAGRVASFQLSTKKTRELNEFARSNDATLFMVLLAVFNIFLAKISSREDIIIGTPIAGRRHVDLEQIIGMFLNTLALRNFPTGDRSFITFLHQVREETLKAYENQDYPFEDLVENTALERDVSRNPMFDVMFIHQNVFFPTGSKEITGEEVERLKIGPYAYENKTAKFDLTLMTDERRDNLHFSFEYCTNLYKPETIERFIKYLQKIIDEVMENPAGKISRIEIMTEEEKKQVLQDFNDTWVDYPKDKVISQLFEEQAEKTPGNIAAVGEYLDLDNNGQGKPGRLPITYKELNRKSNQLATLLREKGVKSNTVVGILVDRSLDMIVGILGILKAGGAYLPLDPIYPEERQKYIMADSSASLILTNKNFKELIGNKCETVEIGAGRLSSGDGSKLDTVGKSTDLAYVIYTSGSTGRPKGVMIEHRSLANFIKGMTDIIDFQESDCILSLTTISFDIFGLETILPLTKGSKVVMGSETEQLDTEAALGTIAEENVTILQVTPSRLSIFISNEKLAGGLKSLKSLIVGGEAFPEDLLNKTRALRSGKIYNVYGPTETTIWSTVKDVSGEASLNIGKPIANTQIYILDQAGTLQPIGITGELCIGGDGVARGYLNRPELTFEKFLFFSYRSYISKKIYKTGDLARWLTDGNIEFLGRIDHQVKLRGFRIELEEIERQLMKHKNIKEALVLLQEDREKQQDDQNSGKKYLTAYIAAEEEMNTSQLREYLSKELPDYMVPSFFVKVERIPLTPNGKIDRKALAAYGVGPDASVDYIAPRNDIEKRIAGLWMEVLKLEKVGIYENFFDLGGTSMDIIKLNSKFKEVFNEQDIVVQMFRYSTVSSFTQYLNRKRGGAASPQAVERTVQIDRIKKTRANQKSKRRGG
jgi:amino acid adenylation domain-containing protein